MNIQGHSIGSYGTLGQKCTIATLVLNKIEIHEGGVVVLKNILWGIVVVVIIAFAVYSEYRRRKKPSDRSRRPQTENEKEVEKQTAIEKEKSRRYPPGGNGLY